MAETMTYDPGTDTVTTEGNLTAEEQESLSVGEDIQSQQEQMLAGKYKNAEELEKAYIELEKKLGSDGQEKETPEAEAETKSEEVLQEESEEGAEEPSPAVALVTEASSEYYANDGKLSEETIDKFSSMSSKDLVNAYMDIVKNNPQDQAPAQDISDADINVIKNSVGGESQYSNMINWAGQNLNAKATEAFDNVVASGNVQMIQLAVAGLKAQFDEANGYEGRMLTGKESKASGDVFRSQQELVSAMSDSRYENDPAYRQDVIEKLDRSDINF